MDWNLEKDRTGADAAANKTIVQRLDAEKEMAVCA
jgi:hypothetical protein